MTRGTLNTYDDPSGLFAAVGTTLAAVLTLVGVFVDLPPGFGEALLAVVATLGPLVTALAIRRHAYAPATVRHEVDLALGGAAQVLDARQALEARQTTMSTGGSVEFRGEDDDA